MKFTGERFIPTEQGRIRLEHYHRYTMVLEVVKGKSVLDVACGEGYGSALMADVAHIVAGVDISKEAIHHASSSYSKPNLKFYEGSATNLEFPDSSFDVVVSFETIEHLIEQKRMLLEIRRVLRPDGLLVISSPNRPVYSEESGEHNEFHVKELDFQEFDELLQAHFSTIKYFGQRLLISSVIQPLNATPNLSSVWSDDGSTWSPRAAQLENPVYFLAVCGSNEVIIPEIGMSTLYPGSTDLVKHYVGFAKWAKSLEQLVIERDRQIIDLSQVVTERDERIAYLSQAMTESNSQIVSFYNSASWRVTRPLRIVARIARYGLTNQDRQWLIQALRNRYHRLPLPAPVKNFIRFTYHQVLRKIVWLSRRSVSQVVPFYPPAYKPASQRPNTPDYIIWGVIDWHFRHQRPQQLSIALAKTGRRIFYISPTLVDDKRAGFEAEALDDSGVIFQIKLFANGAPRIYSNAPSLENVIQIKQSIGEVLDWADCGQIVSLVDHPFWYGMASVLPNSRLIYDCMDHHEGFGNNAESLMQLEKQLLSDAELVITASAWLDEAIATHVKHRVLIRNAGEYEHFAIAPDRIYRDPQGRRIIGYYGAIAEWFDLDLVESIARQHQDCSVLLIGADTVNAISRLGKLRNITFMGEVPYSKLPYYLHGFDVCLLPFKVVPLTLATNPVKIYEYLSAGKSVVTVDLPEMSQFEGLVYVAADEDAFLAAVNKVLHESESCSQVEKRKIFAREQTWQHRVETLIQQIESSARDPKVSVIVVTYNNLELTRKCLESLDKYSQYERLEIIVVDNASSDGTPIFLSEWVASGEDRKLILNAENKGFAAANNQGLSVAAGEYLVLLNNDTYVTSGWIRTLVRHLQRDKSIGLIGPVTNNIGNEAKIDIIYTGMAEMLLESAAYTRQHIDKTYPLRTAAFFCVMMSRGVYNRVGLLDEAFGRGFFEDDDYCRRVEQLGLRIVCAEDVFIHHHLSASFNKLKQWERQQLFEENKKIYEAKWGKWISHEYRNPGERNAQQPLAVPDVFRGQKYIVGNCVVCGRQARFFYHDVALWRESLNCQHCRSTSRYRSIARGLLRAINELTGVEVLSLAALPHISNKRLSVYDTQPPFYFESFAYPIPDLLKISGWINVELSQFKPKQELGKMLSNEVSNQNLECLTFPDASLDIVITSDVMEHVRLDECAHREIYRILKPGGIYLFTVPHDYSGKKTLERVQVIDPDDPSKDVLLLEPEYHGDTNSDDGAGVLAYRVYGKELEIFLIELGFDVEYGRDDFESLGILNTELFYCRKHTGLESKGLVNVC